MKTFKLLPVILLLSVSFSSCNMLRLNSRNMMNIQKGMSKIEIKRLLGNPEFRNFDRDGEEWVYTTAEKDLIIGFYNEGVESMKTYPAGTYQNRSMYPANVYSPYSTANPNYPPVINTVPVVREKEFQDFFNAVNRQSYKDDKIAAIRNGVANRAFTCSQCLRMMNIFPYDEEKLQVFNIMAPAIVDWENQAFVLNNFKFISTREKASQTINAIQSR